MAKSSADPIGDSIRVAVRKAAKLAVYELIKINVKNHQTHVTKRPDIDLNYNKKTLEEKNYKINVYKRSDFGAISMPCCKNEAAQNQNVLTIVKSLFSFCSVPFCSKCHS